MRPGSGASSSASWTSWSSNPKASPDDHPHAGHEGRPPARGTRMRGPSRASLAAARAQLMAALADPSGAAALGDELFAVAHLLDQEPGLRRALTDATSPAAPRLITQAAVYPRGRSLDATLDEYARLAAAWRQRLIAVVRVAGGLDEDQRARLTAALSHTYGRDIHLNVVIDPEVVGGMSIQIGDEFIDGSLASRLAQLRQRLAS